MGVVEASEQGTVLVTGAGVRIGRAIALRLARAGYDLLLHANRSHEALQTLKEEAQSLGVSVGLESGDFSDLEAVAALGARVSDRHHALKGIIHNAAIYQSVPFADISVGAYREMMAINLDAPFFLTQKLLPLLKRSSDPTIIHIVDVGAERPEPQLAHYSLSKAGLLMLTRSLAIELAPEIRVNAVSPGAVAFPLDFDEARKQEILARVPLGREGSPQDVAKAVLFLLEEGTYLNGETIHVDGGWNVRL